MCKGKEGVQGRRLYKREVCAWERRICARDKVCARKRKVHKREGICKGEEVVQKRIVQVREYVQERVV